MKRRRKGAPCEKREIFQYENKVEILVKDNMSGYRLSQWLCVCVRVYEWVHVCVHVHMMACVQMSDLNLITILQNLPVIHEF